MHQTVRRLLLIVAACAIAVPVFTAADEPVAHPPFRLKVGGTGPMATAGPTGLAPSTIKQIYSLPSSGGSGIIAIVDAFENPNAENDLNVFSSAFGLPSCTSAGSNPCFQKLHAQGGNYRTDQGWALESDLDIEWAHALAPNARIMLVEAKTNSFTNLIGAVGFATSNGATIVSMSWGGSEFSSETTFDADFTAPGVVYLASSGDRGGIVEYPAASPNVIAVGGTTLNFDQNGVFSSETGWGGSGGGPSAIELRPSFQDGVAATVGAARGTPDVSFDGDPGSGVSIFDSNGYHGQRGWFVVGGTSVGAPCWAAIANLAGGGASSAGVNSTMYGQIPSGYGTTFRDILTGTAGSFSAGSGWDFVTGIGSPITTTAK